VPACFCTGDPTVARDRASRAAASQSDRSDTLAPSESGAYSSYPHGTSLRVDQEGHDASDLIIHVSALRGNEITAHVWAAFAREDGYAPLSLNASDLELLSEAEELVVTGVEAAAAGSGVGEERIVVTQLRPSLSWALE
jgi:hypothetical protein